MKTLWTVCLTALLFTSASALPIGNPWDASLVRDGIFWDGQCPAACNPCPNWCDAWSIRFGFYGDYVYNRHLKVDESGNHSTIHRTKVYTNAAYLAYNAFDRFDIFGTLGTTSIEFNGPRREFATVPATDYFFLQSETYFSWSIGARGTLWEWRCLGIGAEAQYFATRPKLNFARGETSSLQYGSGERLTYQEWQVGLGAAYRYYITSCATSLVPYIGVKWSSASLKSGYLLYVDGASSFQIPDLDNDRSVGYAVGITLVGCEKTSVTVEGRFVDETAFHVNAQFRF